MLSLIVLFCVSVVQADLITNNDLDDFVLNEILRNTVIKSEKWKRVEQLRIIFLNFS